MTRTSRQLRQFMNLGLHHVISLSTNRWTTLINTSCRAEELPVPSSSSLNIPLLAAMSSAFVPGNQQRYLRACMVCSIVQTQAVWVPLCSSPDLPTDLSTEVPPRRLPQLRIFPRSYKLDGCGARVHVASLRGFDHPARYHDELGSEVAEAWGLCSRGVCSQGRGAVAWWCEANDRGCRGQIRPSWWYRRRWGGVNVRLADRFLMSKNPLCKAAKSAQFQQLLGVSAMMEMEMENEGRPRSRTQKTRRRLLASRRREQGDRWPRGS